MTSTELVAALAKRFAAPAYAFITQIRNGTGWARSPRTVDALAMSCWPSRGLELHGFEVKVSRRDWIRELREPAKAEEILSYCDRWWLVTPPKGVMQDGELPPTWGHIVVDGRGAQIKTQAPEWRAKPLDRLFLAALLRRVNESCLPLDSLNDRIAAERKAARDEAASTLGYDKSEYERLLQEIDRFEKASGVSIRHSWEDRGLIGEAVRQVLKDSPAAIRARMRGQRDQIAAILAEVEAYLARSTPEGNDVEDTPTTRGASR